MRSSHTHRIVASAKKLAFTFWWKVLLVVGPAACSAFLPHTPLAAQAPAGAESGAVAPTAAPAHVLATASRAERAPLIDGRDDDAVWSVSTPIDGFQQFDPVEGAEASMRTDA